MMQGITLETIAGGALVELFAIEADRDRVRVLLTNVDTTSIRTSTDDGLSQTVSAKVGIVTKADVPVPNPVALAGWRTFREVEPVESEYVLRLQQSHTQLTAGVFEADGGVWRLEAVDRVASYLRVRLFDRLPDVEIPVIK